VGCGESSKEPGYETRKKQDIQAFSSDISCWLLLDLDIKKAET